MRRRISRVLPAFLTVLLFFPGCGADTEKGFAEFSPYPSVTAGQADLVISGNGIDGPFSLDLEFLMSLPAETFSSIDPWDGEEHSYMGVSLVRLLYSCGMSPDARRVTVSAANGYSVSITPDDLRRYGHILVYRMDGETFESAGSLAKRGKLIVAIDFSTHKDLAVDVYKHQLVWQVTRIEVE